MIEIKDLLNRISGLLVGEEQKKQAITQALLEVSGISVTPNQIKIHNNSISINTKPIHKNEIFLKKELILKKIEEMLGNKAPKEIK